MDEGGGSENDLKYNNDIRRFHQKYPNQSVNIDGKDYLYILAGSGATVVVLLSGGFGVSSAWFRHVPLLAKKYTVLTFDYPIEYDNNAALADWFAKLTAILKLPPVVLVGQSYGGCLAQIIAKRYPDIIKGMVLSNTAALTSVTKNELQAMAGKLKYLYRLVKTLPYSWLKPLFLKKSMAKVKEGTTEEQDYIKSVFKDLFAPYTKQKELQMQRLLLGLMDEASYTPNDFMQLEGKTLLLISPDDKTFSDESKQQLIQLMPNTIVNTSIRGGHILDDYLY